MEYNFREIEKKWQKRWVENKTYQVTEDETKKKFYVLICRIGKLNYGVVDILVRLLSIISLITCMKL